MLSLSRFIGLRCSGAGRRRTWSDEDKARIVAEISTVYRYGSIAGQTRKLLEQALRLLKGRRLIDPMGAIHMMIDRKQVRLASALS
jgi:transposase-like protein